MSDERPDTPEERLLQEAEELMRQRRYRDAARRYQDLYRRQPTDLWTSLGFASALECAGEVESAARVLEDAAVHHGSSPSLHRFRQLFFARREDLARASASQRELQRHAIDAGEADQLVDLYFNQGRYREALAEIERQLADADRLDHELRASLLARSGACLRHTGEPERARERLLMALALEPESAWTYAELAEAERALGMVEAAREHYQTALRLAPDDEWTRGHLAQLEFEQGEVERAHALYREILERHPELPWALVEYAQTLLERDPARAAELARQALAADPDYPWAHTLLADLARREGRLDEALQAYQRALEAAPEAVWILHEACETARQGGRLEQAEQYLARARAIDPYDATTHGYYAELRRAQGRLAEAELHLEQAVAIDDRYLWAWRELAEVRALLGKHAEAEQAGRRARELAPDDPANDGLVAFLLKHRGERERMLPWLERAVERQPDYAWAWRELIELHLSAGRLAAAEAAARRALAELPEQAPLIGLTADILRRQGRLDEAEELLQQALAAAPEAPPLLAIGAEIALRAGRRAQASERALRAAELGQGHEYRVLAAQVLAACEDHERAAALLAPVLEDPDCPPIAWELAALLAERRGDIPAAIAAFDRILAREELPRARVRRARLAVQRGEKAAAEALLPLVERGDGDIPWGELATTLALAGHAAAAWRAALRQVGELPPAEAHLLLAEVAWHLDDAERAARHLADAVAEQPDDPLLRTFAGLVAEAAGDWAAAAEHYSAAAARRPQDPQLARQLAVLAERRGEREAAADAWRRLLAVAPAGSPYAIEAVAGLWRHDRIEEAEPLTEALLAGPPGPERLRLRVERALALARRDGAAAGLAALEAPAGALGLHGHLVGVQLAIAAHDHAAAERHLAALRADPAADAQMVELLRLRLLLDAGAAPEAVAAARALLQQAPQLDEAQVALAEGLVALGRVGEAYDALAAKPPPWSAGRALFTALVALAAHGRGAAAACLARHPEAERTPLGAALALACGIPLAEPPRLSAADLLPLPPDLALPLMRALRAAGHPHAAEAVGERALEAVSAERRATLRRELRRALRQRAGLRAALADAWRAGDWGDLWRLLRPRLSATPS